MPSVARLPINPEIITWSRNRFNMSLEYAADKIGIKPEQLAAYEAGTESPTYNQLEEMAKTFCLPLEVFFYPEPPSLEKPDVKHRAQYSEYLQDTPTEILLVMNNAAIMQNRLNELCNGKNPSSHLITRENFTGTIAECAKHIRSFLGVPIEKQPKFRNYYEALNYWRDAFADAGIYIFKENFSNDGYSGFCMADTEFPIIYLNSAMLPQRQIFTIFHELWHLIKNTNGIDFFDAEAAQKYLRTDTLAIEKECDAFAGEYLVPAANLNETIQQNTKIEQTLQTGTPSEIQILSIKPLARKYCVSPGMLLVRLIKTGYLPDSAYAVLKLPEKKKNTSEEKEKRGPDYYTTTLSQLGRPYVELVHEKQTEYGFEDYKAAEYLGVKTKSLDGLNAKLLGV